MGSRDTTRTLICFNQGVIIMDNKNIEMMKKIIEEKKKKGLEKSSQQRAQKSIGQGRSAGRSSKKTGGLFDK